MIGGRAEAVPVLCLGEVLIDLIASDDATRLEDVTAFAARPGGAPANAAVALARLGTASAFCGVVGDDPFGARLRATLAAKGVDTTRLRATPDAETTIAFAWRDTRGDGHFRLLRLADCLLSPDDVAAAGVDRVGAMVVGSVALAAEPSRSAVMRAAEIAAASNVPLCFDVNLRPTIWPDLAAARTACEPLLHQATLLKLSLDDAQSLFPVDDAESALARLDRYGAPFVVLTDGARGAWFGMRGLLRAPADRFVPAFAVDAVDPTGAGDAFTAAVVSRLIANQWERLDREDIVFASAAGALTTMRRGAIDALPSADEIESFLAVRAGEAKRITPDY
ncbi:MAG: fructokinase [Thermomicrobiales bacterium]|nr:fructokinase [Thermomicrobiales bacterium]